MCDKNNLRTEEERKRLSIEVINMLSDLGLSVSYEPIKKLYFILKKYNQEGNRIEVNIPFPEINRRIKGVLPSSKKEESTVRLVYEKF
jgi:hypothetical protein